MCRAMMFPVVSSIKLHFTVPPVWVMPSAYELSMATECKPPPTVSCRKSCSSHSPVWGKRWPPPDTLLTHKTLCSVLPSAQVYSIFYSCLFLKRVSWAKEMALSGKGLPWKQETQVWAPSTHIRSYMWWHVPSGQGAGDAETGGSLRLTAWPALLNQQAIMRCQRPCLSRKEEVNRERHQKLTSDLHVHEHPCMNTQKHIHIPYTYFK